MSSFALIGLSSPHNKDVFIYWFVYFVIFLYSSVNRILDIVKQFNSSLPLAIGERYGYNLQKDSGYNYLTGGGGVILSRAAIMKYSKKICPCPSPKTPDDMYLFGVCFKRMDIQMVHTPLIHQVRGYLTVKRGRDFIKMQK